MIGYINKYSTISRVNSFEYGILKGLDKVDEKTQHPNYKEILSKGLIRRMGNLIKMSLGSALSAKGEADIEGVIVGTALGCLDNTTRFLKEGFEKSNVGLLAPTSFILSTHNSLAGQIGLFLQNHGVNSTHTNRGTSFETALLDGLILAGETEGNILVGGVDEKTIELEELSQKSGLELNNFSEGASFFLLSSSPTKGAVKIMDCQIIRNFETVQKGIAGYLANSSLPKPDLILFGNSNPISGEKMKAYGEYTFIDYSQYSGIFPTNMGFGMQYGAEIISSKEHDQQCVLVVNNFAGQTLGMILLNAE